ncbi:mitofilin family membrane protein [Emcibacter sp. SYSU 3D8]|uniref:COG4223 family protein n=1 Tax=Emcibacter sp. SYSU 3D8 TaxID=3133969 RepID=UPI0031FF1FD9
MTDVPPSAEKPAKPARKKRSMLPLLVVVLLAAMFAAGVLLAPRIMASLPGWMTGASAPLPDAAVAAPAEPAAQSAALPAPEAEAPDDLTEPEPTAPVPDAGELARQVAALEIDLARLQGEVAAEASTAEAVTSMGSQIAHMLNQLAEQQQRLAVLEQTSSQTLLKPMTVLALARLRQAAEQGAPYAGALGGVHRLLDGMTLPEPASTALLTLDAHQNRGVVSAMALRDQFAEHIDDIIDAESAPAEASWWDRTLARLMNMVTVRPTGEVKGQDAPAIVARAEAALNRGDVDQAAGELQELSPAAALAAADWLRQAQTRQSVLASIDTLEAAILDEAAPQIEDAPQ